MKPNTKSIVIIDASVENYQQLFNGVVPGVKPFLLGGDTDGIQQIGDILQKHPETDTLHIISHGSPGCLYLGNSQLSLDTLKGYESQLQQWQLDNLLLYGCNVAAGDGGEEFIRKLHRLTGAEIAASKSLTGAAVKGGNWELEVRTAQTKPSLALQVEAMASYSDTLNLQFEWAKQIGGGSSDYAESITTDSSGNVLLAGDFWGNIDIDGDGNNDLTSNGNLDGYAAKFDSNGNLVWGKQIGGSSSDRANSITTDSSGNVLVGGYFYGNIDIDGDGNNDFTSNGDHDGFVVKFSDDTNSPPTDLDLDNKTIDENVAPNSVVGTFSTTDPDSGDSFTYTLVTGNGDTDNSAFTINGDQLQINDSPDYETKSSYSVRVQTTDGDGASYTEQLTINVNDVNEAPTDLDLDNKTIDENVAPNSVVGTFSTTDPDSGDSFTYTLVTGNGDTDNSAFTINGDQLKINDSPDYETKSSYSIRVQTTDKEGASHTEQLTINVNDVNEDVIEGTPGKDIFRGSDTAENYSALAGNDRVYGNGGDDTIDGGEGNDIIYGGNDDDLLNGGLGGDRLYGDDGNDQLLGQDGNDILYGGAGDDILNGGPGNDRYNGGAGTDTLIIAPGMGLDMIQGFEDGTDTIKLEGGIGFADLDIVSSGSSTLIKLTATQETLARISGIDVSLVGEADFTV